MILPTFFYLAKRYKEDLRNNFSVKANWGFVLKKMKDEPFRLNEPLWVNTYSVTIKLGKTTLEITLDKQDLTFSYIY